MNQNLSVTLDYGFSDPQFGGVLRSGVFAVRPDVIYSTVPRTYLKDDDFNKIEFGVSYEKTFFFFKKEKKDQYIPLFCQRKVSENELKLMNLSGVITDDLVDPIKFMLSFSSGVITDDLVGSIGMQDMYTLGINVVEGRITFQPYLLE